MYIHRKCVIPATWKRPLYLMPPVPVACASLSRVRFSNALVPPPPPCHGGGNFSRGCRVAGLTINVFLRSTREAKPPRGISLFVFCFLCPSLPVADSSGACGDAARARRSLRGGERGLSRRLQGQVSGEDALLGPDSKAPFSLMRASGTTAVGRETPSAESRGGGGFHKGYSLTLVPLLYP